MTKDKIKIVSLDPGTKHLGFASFVGIELTDAGVKSIRQGSEKVIVEHTAQVVSRMLDEKQPNYLVLEKNNFSQVRQNLRLVSTIATIKYLASRRGIITYEYDLRTIRKEVCNDGNASKRRVAEVLITYFPELRIYLHSDKASTRQYHWNMFDAVAVGMTFIRQHVDNALPIHYRNFSRV